LSPSLPRPPAHFLLPFARSTHTCSLDVVFIFLTFSSSLFLEQAGDLYRKRRKEMAGGAKRAGSPFSDAGSSSSGKSSGNLSTAMGGLSVAAAAGGGTGGVARSSLGAAGASMMATPASPKGQMIGDGRDQSQGDNLRGRRASPKAAETGAGGSAYGTRGAQRGLFGR
jgi:hypothetical protein